MPETGVTDAMRAGGVGSTAVALAVVVAAQQRDGGSLAVAWRWGQLGGGSGSSAAEAAQQR
jgi:hypothetical protein